MTLEDFLPLLSVTDQSALRERLNLLSQKALTRQFVINLWAESRLTQAAWQDFAQEIIATHLDETALRRAASKAFSKHTLCGDEIPSLSPNRFGRATKRTGFYAWLIKSKACSSPHHARSFVSSLVGKPATIAASRLRLKMLSEYSMWATWNPSDPIGGDPFSGFPTTADGYHQRIGLPPEKGDLLLFIYSLPVSVMPRFPTVCDGYVSPGWIWYFRPANPGENHGWTMPREATFAPIPEVIHEPITGATLVDSVRNIRGQR